MDKRYLFMAAGLLLSISCQRIPVLTESALAEVKMTVNAEVEDETDDVKTYLDGRTVLWGRNEFAVLSYNDGNDHISASTRSSVSSNEGKSCGSFDFSLTVAPASSYTLGGIYPASAVFDWKASPSALPVNLPSVQNPSATSYDPAAFIMVMKPETVSSIPSEYTGGFRRGVALNKLTLKGLKESVKSVVVSTDGKGLAGRREINLKTGESGMVTEAVSNVTVNYSEPLPSGNRDIWFTTWGTAIAEGENLTITVYGSDNVYSKTIAAHAGGILFKEGCLNTLSCDFSSIEASAPTLLDFAREFVKCLDAWENSVGRVDADGKHNGNNTGWQGAHFIPISAPSGNPYGTSGNQYGSKYSPWSVKLGNEEYKSEQCWEIAQRGMLDLVTKEGSAELVNFNDNRNHKMTLANGNSLTEPVPIYSTNCKWGATPWYEYDNLVKYKNTDINDVGMDFIVKVGAWHVVRSFIKTSCNSPLGNIGNYQEFGTSSSTLNLDGYVGYISPMREMLILARFYKYLLDNGITENVYDAVKDVRFDFDLYGQGLTEDNADRRTAYFSWGGDMLGIPLAHFAKKGIGTIILNDAAVGTYGTDKVRAFIEKAAFYGIDVHMWMQAFYSDGNWILPVKDGTYNQDRFDAIIASAESYIDLGAKGIHFDYLRFNGAGSQAKDFPCEGGTGTKAITEFCRQAKVALKAKNPDVLLSAALMAEKGGEPYYGQKPADLAQHLDILMPMVYRYYAAGKDYGASWSADMAGWFVGKAAGNAEVWPVITTYEYVDDSNVKGFDALRIRSEAEVFDGCGTKGVVFFRYTIGQIPDMKLYWGK